MKLSRVSSYFDRLVCRDAYGTAKFKAQLNLFDDSTRDGLGSIRRVLSTDPAVVIPPRRVIDTGDKHWLVGENHPDYFADAPIRYKYTLHQVDGLGRIRSLADFLADAPGTQAYMGRVWTKAAKQVEVSSALYNVFELFFSEAESLSTPCVVSLDTTHFLAHTTYPTEGGFLAASAVELPAPIVALTYAERVYNPVEGVWSDTPKTVVALRIRWQDHFRYFAGYSERYQEGDVQFVVRTDAGVTPKAGDEVMVGGQAYRVVAVYDEEDTWGLHGRPA